EEVEQPGPDDRAIAPGPDHAGYVGDELRLLQQFEALRVGVHQAVLDAVVHHLGVVPGADRSGVREAELPGRLQCVEDRLCLGDILVRPAHHQRVPELESPDAAGDTRVDVADAQLGEPLGPGLVVGELGVAAVNDQIAWAEYRGDRVDGLFGDSCRHH